MPREPPDVILQRLMAGGAERLAIAALEDQPAGAGVVNLAAGDPVAGASGDADAKLPHVADFAGVDANAASSTHFDAIAQASLHEKSAKADICSVPITTKGAFNVDRTIRAPAIVEGGHR